MSATGLRVVTVIGTRPEIIRLSRVIPLLDDLIDHTLVHTGQNYDASLNDRFFEELDLRRPDIQLGIDRVSLGAALGDVLTRIEPVLIDKKPHALLVLGDTNSSLAAIMAKRMKITVYHMEAGNRSFDENVPEEINRRIIDHIADFNLPYTEHARRHLLAEGLHPRRTVMTGSPLAEVLSHYRPQIHNSRVLSRLGLEPDRYFLASIHREENVDNPEHLRTLVSALTELAQRFELPVIVSTHPRTQKRLQSMGQELHYNDVKFLDPFGFLDYNALQLKARCVLSDSGTIGEESAILGFPAVTVRNSMERPEAMESGTLVLTGLNTHAIADGVTATLRLRKEGRVPETPAEYQITNCSERVVKLIVGTARLNRVWSGLA